MEENNEEPGTKYSVVAMETTQKLQRICSNIVGYCRTVMNSAGKLRVQYFWWKRHLSLHFDIFGRSGSIEFDRFFTLDRNSRLAVLWHYLLRLLITRKL